MNIQTSNRTYCGSGGNEGIQKQLCEWSRVQELTGLRAQDHAYYRGGQSGAFEVSQYRSQTDIIY